MEAVVECSEKQSNLLKMNETVKLKEKICRSSWFRKKKQTKNQRNPGSD